MRERTIAIMNCDFCGKRFERDLSLIKKTLKNGYSNFYCSKECLINSSIKRVERECSYCGKIILSWPSKISDNKFCNQECFKKWRAGKHINLEIDKNLEDVINDYNNGIKLSKLSDKYNCSIITIRSRLQENDIEIRDDTCKGEEHRWYKGGYYENKDGYMFKSIYNYSSEYFNILKQMTCKKGNNILEHRAEMAIHLNRTLLSDEIVHHKNGIRNDNRISNLQLVTRSNHLGEVRCPYCNNIFGVR